jgi:hypothetical protein
MNISDNAVEAEHSLPAYRIRIMFNDIQVLQNSHATKRKQDSGPSRRMYFDLLNDEPSDHSLAAARRYLTQQLQAADRLACDLPDNVGALASWIEDSVEQVGHQYRDYLEARKAGAARRYFSNKSHALYFLKSVAPTKTVDGSWLYGLVQHWNDARFSALIRIYLEELGEGIADKNHVLLYQKLLAAHGCEQWDKLSDEHYVQGAIQLSLAHQAAHFLPEVIGFNLGYEQLPLHLLITAYELNELGIDPYYFTLHITVDNAGTGHAKKSLEGLLDTLPRLGDADAFYRRVVNGYKLNLLGASTNSVIDSFDLQQELVAILAEKSTVGKQMHSDYCRVAGRTVNDWLSDAERIPEFLDSLEASGWIQRHQDPQRSRFWKLIQGDRAEMFGVFNAYEQQVIYDWIAGDAATDAAAQSAEGVSRGSAFAQRQLTFKARRRLLDTLGQRSQSALHGANIQDSADSDNDFNMELRMLEEKLAALASKEETMNLLAGLISPANHHTAPGLMATRIFTRMLG